jgi:hypothetical protein
MKQVTAVTKSSRPPIVGIKCWIQSTSFRIIHRGKDDSGAIAPHIAGNGTELTHPVGRFYVRN